MDEVNNRHRGSNWRAKIRDQLRTRGWKNCAICREPLKGSRRGTVHIDHIKPLSKGGKDELSNMRLVHGKCNDMRGNESMTRAAALQRNLEHINESSKLPELGSIERSLQNAEPGPVQIQRVGGSLDVLFGKADPYGVAITLNPNGSYKAAQTDIEHGDLSYGGSDRDFPNPPSLSDAERIFKKAKQFNAHLVKQGGRPRRVDVAVEGAVLELNINGSWNLNTG